MSRIRAVLFAFATALIACALTAPVQALVVAPPATNDNTSAPVDDPGWVNVGDRGVYLGDRWVITASHVGAGATYFPGVGSFASIVGSEVRLQNPVGQGLSTYTDLLLFRLATDPGLPPLSIAASSAPAGGMVTLIGDGRSVTPSASETQWQVAPDPQNANSLVWNEVPSGGNASGYISTMSQKL